MHSKYLYHGDHSLPNDSEHIFVFGSNTMGIHGAGAALAARNIFKAELGVGHGITGRAYALPTKTENFQCLRLREVKRYVDIFAKFTHDHPELKFWVTGIGCGLAGNDPADVAPMFRQCNTNCDFPKEWCLYLE